MATRWELEGEFAQSLGWRVVFNAGRVWGWNYYTRNGEAVWQVSKEKYARGKLNGSNFFVSKIFDSLDDALRGKNESKRSVQAA